MWINGLPDESEQLQLAPDEILNSGMGHVIAYRKAMGWPTIDGVDIIKIKAALRTLFANNPFELASDNGPVKKANRQYGAEAYLHQNGAQIFFMHYLAVLHQTPIKQIMAIYGEKYGAQVDFLMNMQPDTKGAANIDPQPTKDMAEVRSLTYHTLQSAA